MREADAVTRAPHVRAVHGRHARPGSPTVAGPGTVSDPGAALVAYLQRVDDLLQERVVVLAHVQRVDAHELFTHVRAELWARREEIGRIEESERLTTTWIALARHARTLARRAEGRSAPPVDHAALDAARGLPATWRRLPGAGVQHDPETAVFRAMGQVREPARSVLVLRWLGVGADDVADVLALGEEAVSRLLYDARVRLHEVLAGGGGR